MQIKVYTSSAELEKFKNFEKALVCGISQIIGAIELTVDIKEIKIYPGEPTNSRFSIQRYRPSELTTK